MAYRNRYVLNRFNNWRLKLAEPLEGRPGQWKKAPKPADPIVKTVERKMLPLSQSLPPYEKYQDKEVERIENFEPYWDPLFNPHLNDERHRVDPEQEPFCAIYADTESDAANQYTKCRNIATPELWSYVERLARIKIAPRPPVRRKENGELVEYPSGFVPPPENPPDLPYFVPRTRNHLLPVYYRLHSDPEECYTHVRQVTGNLWNFEEDVRTHLESLSTSKRRILTSVRETDEQVLFRGKHLHEIVDWLLKKGF